MLLALALLAGVIAAFGRQAHARDVGGVRNHTQGGYSRGPDWRNIVASSTQAVFRCQPISTLLLDGLTQPS